MIGRGCYGRPWFPAQVAAFLRTGERIADPSLAEQKRILLTHYDAMLAHFGTDAGIRLARKHVSWYSRGLSGSAEFRAAMSRRTDPAEVLRLIDALYDPLIARGETATHQPRPAGGSRMRNPVSAALRVVARRETGRQPDPAALMSALPVPVMLLDAEDRFRFTNPAAEQFLGVSVAQASQMRLCDLVPKDNPIFLLLAQVREDDVIVADHDMTLESPRLHKQGITVQGTPLPEEPGCVLLVMQDASAARALDRQLTFRSAARSVTGMAAILAHEVKNPLSGIRGAAQLLEGSVAEQDRELTVLIRDEADRIRALVDRMEIFGEKPIVRGAVNIHRVLEHVRRLAQSGFAAHHPLLRESTIPRCRRCWAIATS